MHMIGPLERRRVNFPARSFKHAYSSIVISFPEIALVETKGCDPAGCLVLVHAEDILTEDFQ